MKKPGGTQAKILLGISIVLFVLAVALFHILSREKPPPKEKIDNSASKHPGTLSTVKEAEKGVPPGDEKPEPSPPPQEEKLTYEDIKKAMCQESLSREEKARLWEEKFKGKRVTWKGYVHEFAPSSERSGPVIFVKNDEESSGGISLFLEKGASLPNSLKKGTRLSYSGTLFAGLGPESHFYISLADVKVLEVKEKEPLLPK